MKQYAFATEEDDEEVEEIVVTATRHQGFAVIGGYGSLPVHYATDPTIRAIGEDG